MRHKGRSSGGPCGLAARTPHLDDAVVTGDGELRGRARPGGASFESVVYAFRKDQTPPHARSSLASRALQVGVDVKTWN